MLRVSKSERVNSFQYISLCFVAVVLTAFCGDRPIGGRGICGNAIAEDGEDCDGVDLRSTTCADFFFPQGALVCSDECEYDTNDCHSCGDAIAEFAEQCDGEDLKDQSCPSLGYYGGQLGCSSGCVLDTSDCELYGRCGDGVVQEEEDCDDANTVPLDGCHQCGIYPIIVNRESGGRQVSPSVEFVEDGDGLFFVTWLSEVNNDIANVMLSSSPEDSARFSGDVWLGTSGPYYALEGVDVPSIVFVEESLIVVTWFSGEEDSTLLMTWLDWASTPNQVSTEVRSEAGLFERSLATAAGDDTQAIFAAWEGVNSDFSSGVHVAEIGLSLGALTSQVDIQEQSGRSFVNPVVVNRPGFGPAIVWMDIVESVGDGSLLLQCFDQSLQESGSETMVELLSDRISGVDVAELDQSNFVIVWGNEIAVNEGVVRMQIFDASCMAISSKEAIAIDASEPRVASNAFGDFFVVWRNLGGNGASLMGRRFDSSGDTSGEIVEISSQTDVYRFDLAIGNDGRVMAVWCGEEDGITNEQDILAQRISYSDELIGRLGW